MSEQDIKSGCAADSSAMLVQSATSRHKQPIRPMDVDVQEETPMEAKEHHKRSKTPNVPSSTEEIKEIVNTDSRVRTDSDRAMTSGKQKYNVAKNLSSINKRRSISPESIVLTSLSPDVKQKESVPRSQPIPAQVSPSKDDSSVVAKHSRKKKEEDDSISEDIAELRTPEVVKDSSEWSDEEEAGGLPRSESRASRVSRAMRQLFCCGIALDPPSEHNVSPRTEYQGI